MKKIFVTVKEFVANGGNLVEGRQLFKYVDSVNGFRPDWSYSVNDGIDTNSENKYVQIDCQPIYK